MEYRNNISSSDFTGNDHVMHYLFYHSLPDQTLLAQTKPTQSDQLFDANGD